MAGIYVHIPFCRQACSYCDFYFSVNKRHEKAFFNALRTEWALRKRETEGERIDTIYFGGGTPSYAHPDFIGQIIDDIRQNVFLSPQTEITLEANPDDITSENLRRWKEAGINRLSIGVQSFDNRFLRMLNRSHDARTAKKALENALSAGFDNLNVDLIYGLPRMRLEDWVAQIDRFLLTDVPHLSAYALTVEPKTLLEFQVKKGILSLPSEEEIERQFYVLRDKLTKAGFRHYEISNFARPGFESRHNRAYWQGKAYIGLGPSAHSYDGKRLRRWNTANLHRYIQGTAGKGPWYETETLSDKDLYNEYVMTRLRTDAGIDDKKIRTRFPVQYAFFRRTAEKFLRQGDLTFQNGRYRVADSAWFRTDGIIREFFMTD